MSHPARALASASADRAFAQWGEAAVYTAPSGVQVQTIAIVKTADVIALDPRARARQTGRKLELKTSDVSARPKKGATVVIGSLTYSVLEDAVSEDPFNLIWICRVAVSVGKPAFASITLAPALCVANARANVIASATISIGGLVLDARVTSRPRLATASVTLQGATAVGTVAGTQGHTADLNKVLAALTVSAAAVAPVAAVAAIALGGVSANGAAALTVVTTNAVTLQPAGATGVATASAAAAVATTLGALTASGAAKVDLTSAAALSLGGVSAAGIAAAAGGKLASLNFTLGGVSAVGAVKPDVASSAAITLGGVTVSAAASTAVQPTESITLAPIGVTASAKTALSASGAATLAPLAVSAGAQLAVATINAYTLAPPVLAAAAAVANTAAGSVALGKASASGVATVSLAPAATPNFAPAVVAATALATISATAGITLGGAAVSATATVASASSDPAAFGSIVATDNNTVTSYVMTKPSGVVSGNLLVAALAVYDSTTVTITPPAGWSAAAPVARRTTGNVINIFTFYKIAGGSEPSTYTFTNSVSRYTVGVIARYTGANATTPIDTNTSGNSGSGTTVTGTGITTTVANTRLICVTAGYNYGSSTPSGMTDRAAFDGVNHFFDQVAASAGSTGNRTGTQGGSDSWVAVMFAIRPA